MGTTKKEIREWFESGVEKGATYMLIICDTYDYEDYPVFVSKNEDLKEVYDAYHYKNMQKVMEVYDLRKNKETQLNTHRAFVKEAV